MSKNEKSDRIGFRIYNSFRRYILRHVGLVHGTEQDAHVNPKRLLILDLCSTISARLHRQRSLSSVKILEFRRVYIRN